MTIGTKNLADCANACIATTCNPLEILQLSSIAKDFDQGFVKSVANCAALPSAANNKGRWIYLQDTCSYRWSDGNSWSNDFTSVPEDFSIYAWGNNSLGKLGTNNTVNTSSPVGIVGGFSDWCQANTKVANHNLAIRSNGTLWSWGRNSYGQLGSNDFTPRSSPISVVGGFTDWCQASAGYSHSLAIRSNGQLWSWGNNSFGRLGDDTTTNRNSPVSVLGGFADWCQASAGLNFSVAVRSNGTLWAWGFNNSGGLGDCTTVTKSSPVSVVGGFTDWCTASAGAQHTLGVRCNGTLWAWGNNGQGRLGDNTTVNKSSPVSVVGGFTDWCQASASYYYSIGLRSNGSLWAWGCNGQGRLGDNTTINRSSPVSVVGGFTDWCQATVGWSHTLGVRTNGTVWAWGSNGSGNLGDNTTTDRSSPVSISGGLTGWTQVGAGFNHSVALRNSKGF